MTPEEFVAAAEQRLVAAKFAVERDPVPATSVVGRRRPFRVRWVLTQLKTSVVVAGVETVTAEGWTRFTQDAFAVAKAIKGGLPTGFQAGVGCVAVLAATNVDPGAAAAAAERPHVQLFTGLAMPALVDLSNRRVHQHEGRVAVGMVYVPFLRKQRSLVTSIVEQEH